MRQNSFLFTCTRLFPLFFEWSVWVRADSATDVKKAKHFQAVLIQGLFTGNLFERAVFRLLFTGCFEVSNVSILAGFGQWVIDPLGLVFKVSGWGGLGPGVS